MDIWRGGRARVSFERVQNVLLAEPEPLTRGFLERHLRQDGFAVVEAQDGEAIDLLERSQPDVVLVSDELALELCSRLREGEPGRSWNRELPVIVLGGQQADAVDRVRAFARGADDFVARPFHYEELVARIRAVLRRTQPPPGRVLRAGEIEVDTATRRVTVAGERVILPGKEYELLVKLAGEPDRVFTKEELLREVWGFRSLGRTRTLDSHASRLRRRLAAPTGAAYVKNVWGVGYCLLGD